MYMNSDQKNSLNVLKNQTRQTGSSRFCFISISLFLYIIFSIMILFNQTSSYLWLNKNNLFFLAKELK